MGDSWWNYNCWKFWADAVVESSDVSEPLAPEIPRDWLDSLECGEVWGNAPKALSGGLKKSSFTDMTDDHVNDIWEYLTSTRDPYLAKLQDFGFRSRIVDLQGFRKLFENHDNAL